ncbi:VWA domain-containing protein [Actinomadura geliboluensis]|uniref:VWA domain-containing protein n=1 Tax=Actinomadura geliboluensis TaxID=882440 RepID=UPI0037146E30
MSLSAYQSRVNREHEALGGTGTTNYAAAMRKAMGHYLRSGVKHPAFVIFQTTRAPDNPTSAERALRNAANLPISWQFAGVEPGGGREFDFLRKLDTLQDRAVDNAGFFEAGPNPASLSDADPYDQLMAEHPVWLAAAAARASGRPFDRERLRGAPRAAEAS